LTFHGASVIFRIKNNKPNRHRTKPYPDVRLAAFRATEGDIDLWRSAARKEEVSRSEFLRLSLKERARRVLLRSTTEHEEIST